MTHNFPLPNHFLETLYQFVYQVMEKKPTNYMQYAARYFGKSSNNESLDRIISEETQSISEITDSASVETMDSEAYADRRKSVAAEHFNPEDIDSNELLMESFEKTEEQKLRLKSVCKTVALFKSLNESDIMTIIDAMFEITVEPNQVIIKEHDTGDNFYIIESGCYDAFITQNGVQKQIKSYENEGNFGELALIYNAPRAASVISSTKGVIWAVTRQVFRSVVLTKAHRQREMYNKLLENVPMLAPLNDFERANIADALTSKDFPQGEIIIKEGDPGIQMFFIISGQVVIYRGTKNNKEILNKLGPGKYFGELALLSNQPRAANAEAMECTKLAVLDVKSFERLMGPCIEIMKRNMGDYKKQVVNLFNV